jgi:hypothetical protein
MIPCRGPNYIEVDVDVSSSRSAAHVVGLVQGALKSLVIDIAILLEGRSPVNPLSCPSFDLSVALQYSPAVHPIAGGHLGWQEVSVIMSACLDSCYTQKLCMHT